MNLSWHVRRFDELTVAQLYAIVALRERVFVVEQGCMYLDADGKDLCARHLWAEAGGELVAYCRIIPAGEKYDEVSIGRVIVSHAHRGSGLGKQLMQRAFAAIGPAAIRIGAQSYLETFYRDLGFVPASEPYVEVGIPHLEMLRAPADGQ